MYIFGGRDGSTRLNTIYKFNITNGTVTKLSTKLPQILTDGCCSIYNDNVFIFGGYNGSIRLNTIYKFNCTSETIETLSITLPQALSSESCSAYNSDIYIFGGYDGTNNLNTIYNFSISFELTANNVLLYCANSKYNFGLITDQVNIPIKNVYIGDSNNAAQLANAYLYDETKSAWVNVNTGEVLTV